MTISLYYLPSNLIWGDGLNKAEKRQIRIKILNIQDENCKGCKTVPKLIGNNYEIARWCSENCEVGKNLKA